MNPAAPRPAGPRPARGFPALTPGLGFLTCAWLAAAAILAGLPPAVCAALAAPVALLGAAYPLLVRAAPDESAALKLALLAWLLSPPLLALGHAAGKLILAPGAALALALAVAGALQLLVGRARLRLAPPGRAAAAALAGSALLGLLAAAAHLAAPSLRLVGDGLWHAGLVAAGDRALAPANPWLAGGSVAHPVGLHALGATLARALQLSPSVALAALSAWAAAALPLTLYLLAAPLWRDGRRELAGVGCALLGWNAAGGFLWLLRGLPRPVVADFGGLERRLQAALPAGEPGLPWVGLLELLLPGGAAPALAFACGGWLCAAHALRHALWPWVGLCGLLHGLALLADPGIGVAALAATALAALVAPGVPLVRPAVLLALLAGSLPALLLARSGSGLGPTGAELGAPGWPTLACGAAALVPAAALLAWPGVRPPAGPASAGRRSVLALLAAGAVAPVAQSLAWVPAGALPGGAGRLAGVALGILAGGGLAGALAAGGRARLAGLLAALLLAGGVPLVILSSGAVADLARRVPAVRDGPLALSPRIPPDPPPDGAPETRRAALDADVVRAYAWLRSKVGLRERGSVLLLGEAHEGQRLAVAARPHPAPVWSDLDLWADRSEPSARRSTRLLERVEALRALLAGDPRRGLTVQRELERLRRPGLLWVGEADRRAHPGLAGNLSRLRFALVHEEGSVQLYAWPPELARDLEGPP